MHPNVDESPIHKTFLKPSMLVFDTVYNPETTLLIKEARTRNCAVITGVEMFVRQAMLQFFLFTRQGGAGRADARSAEARDRPGEVLHAAAARRMTQTAIFVARLTRATRSIRRVATSS